MAEKITYLTPTGIISDTFREEFPRAKRWSDKLFSNRREYQDKQAGRPSQSVDVAQFGDYIFDLSDIRTVVDNYRYWLQRYGTREAVGQVVRDWHDYAVEHLGKGEGYINLFHWLNGAPRDIFEGSNVAAHERPSDEKEEGANG